MNYPLLSQAILEGAKVTKPLKGDFFGFGPNRREYACAMGCAIKSLNLDSENALLTIYPQLENITFSREEVRTLFPDIMQRIDSEEGVEDLSDIQFRNRFMLRVVIAYLNDYANWTRERIAELIASNPEWDAPSPLWRYEDV